MNDSKYRTIKWFFNKRIKIPKEWKVVNQGNVCKFINGYAYSATEFRETGYPIIRIQNLTGGKHFVYSDVKLPEKQYAINGDLLFAWSATFGPFIWKGPKAAYHYHQWKIIPKPNTNKKFLYYHLDNIALKIKSMGQSGLGMFHMTKNGMENLNMLLPSFDEQKKIASILSSVDATIEKTQQKIEETEKLKRGLMQHLLTKGIGHVKFEKVKYLFGEQIKIPSEWTIHKLEDVVEILDSRRIPLEESVRKTKFGKYPYYGASGVIDYVNDYIFDENLLCLAEDGENLRSRVLPIAFTIRGKTWVNNHAHVLRVKITHKFLEYFLNSLSLLKYIASTAQPKLNQKDMRAIPIICPSEAEQRKIASILSGVDAIRDCAIRTLVYA